MGERVWRGTPSREPQSTTILTGGIVAGGNRIVVKDPSLLGPCNPPSPNLVPANFPPSIASPRGPPRWTLVLSN